MDKYELGIKIEQLNKLVRNGDYVNAAKVADQIEWKKMKQWSVMSNAIDAYIAVGKYDKARNVCVYAYNRNLGGRRLLATLTEMYIKLEDYDEAADVYHEFVEMAPKDLSRYVLRYKLRKAQGAPVGELIDILEAYKENELDEAYSYELALLYSEAGLADRCVKECDELVLWFSEGVYVEKALRLKRMYAPLTPKQEETLARLERISSLGLDYDSQIQESAEDEADYEEYTEAEEAKVQSAASLEEDYEEQALVEEEPDSIEVEIDIEPEEDKALKRSNILSIIPEGFKNKVRSVISKESVSGSDRKQRFLEDKDEDTVNSSLQGVMAEIIARETSEDEEWYSETEKPAVTEAATQEQEEPVLDNLENTTSWEPILPEGEEPPVKEPVSEEEAVFNAVIPEDRAEVDNSQISNLEVDNIPANNSSVDNISADNAPADNTLTNNTPDRAEDIQDTSAMAYKEADADEIKIEIKDYSVYDTRNLQQELKASMEELMEAYQNREEQEAKLEAAAEAEYKAASTEEPTKEIVINNHQWRKASRNLNRPANVDMAATMVLDVNAVKSELAGKAVAQEQDVQESPDDQIEGQMDIMQWLAELEEEESMAKAEQPVVETVKESEPAASSVSSRDKERAAIREIAAAIEEAVGGQKKAGTEEPEAAKASDTEEPEAGKTSGAKLSETAKVSDTEQPEAAKVSDTDNSAVTAQAEEMAEESAVTEEFVPESDADDIVTTNLTKENIRKDSPVGENIAIDKSDSDDIATENEAVEDIVAEEVTAEQYVTEPAMPESTIAENVMQEEQTCEEEFREEFEDEFEEDLEAEKAYEETFIEEDFEEIPEIEENEEDEAWEDFEEEVQAEGYISDEEQEDDIEGEDFPDLDEAISTGIDKMIDETISQAEGEHDVYQDIANYVLQPEEKRFLGKYLYMSGMEARLSDFIGEKRLIRPDGTSSSGNAAVMGNKSTDKTAFAVNLVKAIHAFDEEREQTIARTTAENLNSKGIAMVKKKLLGKTLIIENAGKLIRERITDLVSFMNSETQGALIIIADEEFSINKIFMENPDFAAMFTGRFLLKQYSVNELVGIAKDYAEENGWKIEDKALLKLYLIFSRLHNDDQGNIVLAVKDIMDTAAANAGRHIGNRLFKKVRHTLTIKEVDFEEMDEDEEE